VIHKTSKRENFLHYILTVENHENNGDQLKRKILILILFILTRKKFIGLDKDLPGLSINLSKDSAQPFASSMDGLHT
jgi:hypothetical protein